MQLVLHDALQVLGELVELGSAPLSPKGVSSCELCEPFGVPTHGGFGLTDLNIFVVGQPPTAPHSISPVPTVYFWNP